MLSTLLKVSNSCQAFFVFATNDASVALSLRRPSMLTFSPLIGACISFLKRSPWASRSDLQLASWAEMQHIADECASAFSLENASLHEMSDPRLQLTLKGFETRLEDWWKALDPELINPCLRLHFYQNRIFIQVCYPRRCFNLCTNLL